MTYIKKNLTMWLKLRRIKKQKLVGVEIEFYISVMFLGLPDDIHKEKP